MIAPDLIAHCRAGKIADRLTRDDEFQLSLTLKYVIIGFYFNLCLIAAFLPTSVEPGCEQSWFFCVRVPR